jgi:hypothetical protein
MSRDGSMIFGDLIGKRAGFDRNRLKVKNPDAPAATRVIEHG